MSSADAIIAVYQRQQQQQQQQGPAPNIDIQAPSTREMYREEYQRIYSQPEVRKPIRNPTFESIRETSVTQPQSPAASNIDIQAPSMQELFWKKFTAEPPERPEPEYVRMSLDSVPQKAPLIFPWLISQFESFKQWATQKTATDILKERAESLEPKIAEYESEAKLYEQKLSEYGEIKSQYESLIQTSKEKGWLREAEPGQLIFTGPEEALQRLKSYEEKLSKEYSDVVGSKSLEEYRREVSEYNTLRSEYMALVQAYKEKGWLKEAEPGQLIFTGPEEVLEKLRDYQEKLDKEYSELERIHVGLEEKYSSIAAETSELKTKAEMFEELSPTVKLGVEAFPEKLEEAYLGEKWYREHSALYEAGYSLGKFTEKLQKGITGVLPLETFEVHGVKVGEAVESGVAGFIGFPFLLGSEILQGAGLTEAAIRTGIAPSPEKSVYKVPTTTREILRPVGAKKAVEHPAEFGIELGTALATGAAFGLAYQRSPVRPAVTKIDLYGPKGVSIGLEFQRGAYTEFKPALTIMKGADRIISRYPTVDLAKIGREGFAPKLPMETEIIARSIGEEAPKIYHAREVRKRTVKSGVKPEELTPFIEEVLKRHELPPKAAKAIVDVLRTQKAEVYGSVPQKAAAQTVGEVGVARLPRDIDIEVSDPLKFAKSVAERINREVGEEVVEARGTDVIVKKTGKSLFDIHGKGEEYSTRSKYIAYGLKPEKLAKTQEGIQAITLSEQATRKLEGSMRIWPEGVEYGPVKGKIAPLHEGRMKDIADYYFAEMANIKGLELKGKTSEALEAKAHLEQWLEMWGKDIAKSVRKAYEDAYTSQGEKALIARFGEEGEGFSSLVSSPIQPAAAFSMLISSPVKSRLKSGQDYFKSLIESPIESPFKSPIESEFLSEFESPIDSLFKKSPAKSPSQSPAESPSELSEYLELPSSSLGSFSEIPSYPEVPYYSVEAPSPVESPSPIEIESPIEYPPEIPESPPPYPPEYPPPETPPPTYPPTVPPPEIPIIPPLLGADFPGLWGREPVYPDWWKYRELVHPIATPFQLLGLESRGVKNARRKKRRKKKS